MDPATASEQWHGELLIGPSFALFRGAIGDSDSHRHYAAQCVVGEEHDVAVEWGDGRRERARRIFIPSDTPHRLAAGEARVRMLYYEPAMAVGVTPSQLLDVLAADTWREAGWRALFARPGSIDARVRKALAMLETDRDAELGADLDAELGATGLAEAVGLSRNRFMALFSQEIGIPVRRYILWRRMMLAAVAIAGGATLTDAAHGAGFADSAHFARTMKSMFGVSATQGLARLNLTIL
jgi:AraC-like DNA-binding protein